ncbi:MAG: hypothetical protein E5Y73_05420 [Mesorhizobium sp.]|nr:MAG: hypothetical protein E5Y73_05420 [Mesorhizobium sp.]
MKTCAFVIFLALGYVDSCTSAAAESEAQWIEQVNSTFCPTPFKEQEWTTYGDYIYVDAFLDEGNMRKAVSVSKVRRIKGEANQDRASVGLDITLDRTWDENSNASRLIIAAISPFVVLERSLLAKDVDKRIAGVHLELHARPKAKYFEVKRDDNRSLESAVAAYIASPLVGMDAYQKTLIASEDANLKSLIINCINLPEVDVYIEDTSDGEYFDQTVNLAKCTWTRLVLTVRGGWSECGDSSLKRCRDDDFVPVDNNGAEVCAKKARHE